MNDDIHTLSGAYAVDAVDDLERARFEQHLAVCPECRDEVASLRGAAIQLAHLVDSMPPASLREQVLQSITAVRPLPPRLREQTASRVDEQIAARSTSTADRSAAVTARSRWSTQWVAAAAAVVLLGGGAAAVTRPWDRPSQGQLTVAERVLDARDKQTTAQTFPDGASATLVRSKEVGRAVLITHNMPLAPNGKVYQLWLQNEQGAMTPAGLMPPQSDQTVVLDGNAATAKGAGITVEPAGGSSAPTSDPIALFSFA